MTLVWESGITLQHPDNNDPLLDLNTQPSLDLQFATSKTLDDAVSGTNLITFSRASSGTYVDSDGLIKSATTDAPRFDHDPVTGESLGLLIEESRTNLLTYSDYSQTASTTDAQLEGVVAAPDGTIAARRYSVPSAGLDVITKIYNSATVGEDYTFSVWVRSTGTASEVRLIVGDLAVNSVVQISTQWQRLEITKINNASNLVRSYVQLLNVGDEIEVWGAQLEAGAFPTSYIPTSGSTVPRAADVASITGSNFSRWYNQGEGTFIATHEETSTRNVIGAVYGGGAQLRLFSYLNTTRVQFLYGSGTGYFGYSSSPSSPPAYVKTAFYYDGLSYGGTIQGLTPSNLTTTTAPSPSLFEIGRANNVYTFNGRIPRLTYYPYRLSDTILQEITS